MKNRLLKPIALASLAAGIAVWLLVALYALGLIPEQIYNAAWILAIFSTLAGYYALKDRRGAIGLILGMLYLVGLVLNTLFG